MDISNYLNGVSLGGVAIVLFVLLRIVFTQAERAERERTALVRQHQDERQKIITTYQGEVSRLITNHQSEIDSIRAENRERVDGWKQRYNDSEARNAELHDRLNLQQFVLRFVEQDALRHEQHVPLNSDLTKVAEEGKSSDNPT